MLIDPQTIIDMVCKEFGVNREQMFSRSREREIVYARHVCRYLIKFNTTMTLKSIAKMMQGSKKKASDHTTIIHSCHVVNDLMETDDMFETKVQYIQDQIRLIMLKEAARLQTEILARMNKPKVVIAEDKTPVVRMAVLSEQEKVLNKYL